MNVFIVIVLLIQLLLKDQISAQSASDLAAYRKMQDDCAKELKVSADEVKQLNSDKGSPSEALKCYQSCLYKKMGLLSADGKRNDEAILKYAQMRFIGTPVDKLKAQLTQCAATKGDTECDMVWSFEQCMQKGLKA
ncbi:pheromone-binding protein-related protein 6 [Scaptodrosophila lebanonensis]|uniref:Pheromone-binding protein-related protein 6 n=1 Tax=Drosophila lebanonensis TaxID=7225 RepID=A0A6J2UKT2_DROLE|nr:pheromone-binding protein-related protein 6 [Scaptodrosophila lebanonensis]